MNDGRKQILQRLRAARPAPAEKVSPWRDETLFADYPAARELRLENFAAKIATLKAELFRAQDTRAAAAQLKSLLQATAAAEGESPIKALRHAGALLDDIFEKDQWLAQHCLVLQREMANADFEKFQAGVTSAEFLVARTGSIVLLSRNSGGRRLSVLPPFHLVVAPLGQLVDSLDDVFAALHQTGRNETSFMTIITGPSRTSDIEKTLVLGAHGPKRLAIILIG